MVQKVEGTPTDISPGLNLAAMNRIKSSKNASSPLSAASVVEPHLTPAEYMLGDGRA